MFTWRRYYERLGASRSSGFRLTRENLGLATPELIAPTARGMGRGSPLLRDGLERAGGLQLYIRTRTGGYRALTAPGATTLVALADGDVVGAIQVQSDGVIQAPPGPL